MEETKVTTLMYKPGLNKDGSGPDDHNSEGFDFVVVDQEASDVDDLELGAIQVDHNKYVAIPQNTAWAKTEEKLLPKPIIVKVSIDNQPARALIDSGNNFAVRWGWIYVVPENQHNTTQKHQ